MDVTPCLAARYVLMSAYLYYHRGTQVLTDAENDEVCTYVVDNWDDVPDEYKGLLCPDGGDYRDLLTTTHHVKWTKQVEGGALAWLHSRTGERLDRL